MESGPLSVAISFAAQDPSYAGDLPCIDAALNQTWNVQAVFFKLNCSWQFPFNVTAEFFNRYQNAHPFFVFKISLVRQIFPGKIFHLFQLFNYRPLMIFSSRRFLWRKVFIFLFFNFKQRFNLLIFLVEDLQYPQSDDRLRRTYSTFLRTGSHKNRSKQILFFNYITNNYSNWMNALK